MFHRVANGIHERQYYNGGVPIYVQRFDLSANSHPPRWTNQDVVALDMTRVTPLGSSTGNSPLQHCERVVDSVAPPPPPMLHRFHEDPQEFPQTEIIEEDMNNDAVFEMDW
jgi:hypothetical protein